jgi:hypothetical protein
MSICETHDLCAPVSPKFSIDPIITSQHSYLEQNPTYPTDQYKHLKLSEKMTRRTAPSPIQLLPAHIATPRKPPQTNLVIDQLTLSARGTPKYILPSPPRRISLVDTVGPKLRIHAYTTAPISKQGTRAEPARMGLVNMIVPCPNRSNSAGGGTELHRRSDSTEDLVYEETKVGKKIQPPWLRSRSLDEAGAVRMAMGEIRLVPPQEARVRGIR